VTVNVASNLLIRFAVKSEENGAACLKAMWNMMMVEAKV
jgi:hypothetical protein